MAKSKVLGRGLGNLIPINENKQEMNYDGNSNLREIKISEILPNPNQPRKTFSDASIDELAVTIKQHGVIQPVVVQKTDRGYELIAGERRVRACKKAGFQKIPALVKVVSKKESLEMAILENIQRENLNPIDEAMAYQKLSDELGIKISELATRMGKNRSTISNLIRLLNFPTKIQELIRQGKISEGQARPVLSIADERKQLETIDKIINGGWTARQVEDYVAEVMGDSKPKSKSSKSPKAKDQSLLKLESKLRNKYSSKVELQHNENNGKGKIVLHYTNLEQMESILEQMGIKI
ncbi:ParB/RepB/Spo0J family partition protein [Leptospira sp. GIMC2001]|uniref:ParB/RepB/Spo0J family partition protein n=1 Tax=Leptospira sp. GIMC2001 TaxID=1513297 RepID=UPI00234A04ED|nr:ParB/RepB/Spo0J family partition protein [Leptospira sp. GIMC2001]WCL49515.1 ParB/RepB/Spo0J family partition protein [Leptospira sp. GIMC2001]